MTNEQVTSSCNCYRELRNSAFFLILTKDHVFRGHKSLPEYLSLACLLGVNFPKPEGI